MELLLRCNKYQKHVLKQDQQIALQIVVCTFAVQVARVSAHASNGSSSLGFGPVRPDAVMCILELKCLEGEHSATTYSTLQTGHFPLFGLDVFQNLTRQASWYS